MRGSVNATRRNREQRGQRRGIRVAKIASLQAASFRAFAGTPPPSRRPICPDWGSPTSSLSPPTRSVALPGRSITDRAVLFNPHLRRKVVARVPLERRVDSDQRVLAADPAGPMRKGIRVARRRNAAGMVSRCRRHPTTSLRGTARRRQADDSAKQEQCCSISCWALQSPRLRAL